tara:strand:- start:66 stop:281 length:216 start_codon:yes stop_codon:yes gene_type:complete
MELEKANLPEIDEVMKSEEAFLLVDGVGVNGRVLHIFKSKMVPLKETYQRGGRWWFPGCREYTRGGWEYIK